MTKSAMIGMRFTSLSRLSFLLVSQVISFAEAAERRELTARSLSASLPNRRRTGSVRLLPACSMAIWLSRRSRSA
jgi:hypothetical protein